MPANAYPNAVCADGHVEVDHDRTCLRCDKQLVATDIVAVHVTRNPRSRYDREDSNSDDIATSPEWGHAGIGTDPEPEPEPEPTA